MIDLHSSVPPILHRDIKPANILLKEHLNSTNFDDENRYSLVLSDFGISVFMEKIIDNGTWNAVGAN